MWFLHHAEHCKSEPRWTPTPPPPLHCSLNMWVLCSWRMDLWNFHSVGCCRSYSPPNLYINHLSRPFPMMQVTHTSHMGPLPKFQYHPTRDLAPSASKWSQEERKVLDIVLQFNNYEPSTRTNRPVLLCHCKWKKNSVMFIIWMLDQERTVSATIPCSLPAPWKKAWSKAASQRQLSVEHDDSPWLSILVPSQLSGQQPVDFTFVSIEVVLSICLSWD